MSNAETLYTGRTPYPDVLEIGRAQVVSFPLYRDGALSAPTQAGSTLTIYKPNNTKLLDAVAVTVTGSIAQYSIPALSLPTTLDKGEGYLQEWTLVCADGTTRVFRRTMAIALRALYPVITDVDLTAEYPDLLTQLAGGMTHLQTLIDEGWKRIIRQVIRDGKYTYKVMDPDAFADWHRELVHYFAFKAIFRGSGNDRHETLYKLHFEQARLAAAELSFIEDSDHDGRADSEARTGLIPVTHRNAAPRSRRRFSSRF